MCSRSPEQGSKRWFRAGTLCQSLICVYVCGGEEEGISVFMTRTYVQRVQLNNCAICVAMCRGGEREQM